MDIIRLKTVDSTNEEAKRRIRDRLVIIAEEQTGGKGRLGRAFLSAEGKGLYFSCVMRVRCAVERVSEITARAAVAVRKAIEDICGVNAQIKWPNDIVYGGKKLCGILTELYFEAGVPYVILGIGINLAYDEADFAGLSDIAVSVKQICGKAPDKERLFRTVIDEISELFGSFPENREHYLARFRRYCVTTGKNVHVISGSLQKAGFAERIDDDFALVVRWNDGEYTHISSGEVSIR